MLIKLIAIGRLKDKTIDARCREYFTRAGRYGKFELVELPDSDTAAEGRAILRELDREHNSAVIVLTEEGREFTSVEFSDKLKRLDRKAVFVIGGPFGIAPEVKARAAWLWSLSKLTFPHELARLLFSEQLYRALNIAAGGSYHHN